MGRLHSILCQSKSNSLRTLRYCLPLKTCLHGLPTHLILKLFEEIWNPLGSLFKFLRDRRAWWERIIIYHIVPLSPTSDTWWLTQSSQWTCNKWAYLDLSPLAQWFRQFLLDHWFKLRFPNTKALYFQYSVILLRKAKGFNMLPSCRKKNPERLSMRWSLLGGVRLQPLGSIGMARECLVTQSVLQTLS